MAAADWVGQPWRGSPFRLGAERSRVTLVRAGLFGCTGLIAALALAGALVPRPTPQLSPVPAHDGNTVPAWVAIDTPLPMFALAAAPYARLRLDYQARRRIDGAARQDALTFGAFGAPGPFLRLSLERSRHAAEAPPDFVVTVARIAAAAGIAVLRAGQPDAFPSRFGTVAVAPVTLGAAGAAQPCLGFRLEGRPAVEIAGIACAGQGRQLDRSELACTLDRLDLVRAGDDPKLRAMFTTGKPRSGASCAAAGPGRP